MISTSHKYKVLLNRDNWPNPHTITRQIKAVLPAYNNSLLLHLTLSTIHKTKHVRVSGLRHMIPGGKVTWQFELNTQIENISMIKSNELLFYEKQSACITIISLMDYTDIKIHFLKLLEKVQFFYFQESNLLAVVSYQKEQREIAYYDYNGFKRQEKYLLVQRDKSSSPLQKVDRVSQLGYVKKCEKSKLSKPLSLNFIIYSFNRQKLLITADCVTSIMLECSCSLSQTNFSDCHCSIVSENLFNFYFKSPNPKTKRDDLTCLSINRKLGSDKTEIYNESIIKEQIEKHYKIKGKWLIEEDQKYRNRQAQKKITYLDEYGRQVHGEKQSDQIIQQCWVADWNPSILATLSSKTDVRYIQGRCFKYKQIRVFQRLPLKDMYMQMLEHMNQYFDEDLIQEAVELLVE